MLDRITTARSLQHFGADLDGIELRADDADWSYGSGEVIVGHATIPGARPVWPETPCRETPWRSERGGEAYLDKAL